MPMGKPLAHWPPNREKLKEKNRGLTMAFETDDAKYHFLAGVLTGTAIATSSKPLSAEFVEELRDIWKLDQSFISKVIDAVLMSPVTKQARTLCQQKAKGN